jgi:hypothetical protein
MTQQIINIGALPNDGEGDPLRVAFQKVNNNFTNLFATASQISIANTTGNVSGQVIFETEISNFLSAVFQIRSADDNANSQSITINAQLSNDNATVKFSAFGTTFIGDAVCRYDMDIVSSNVRILCNPLFDANLTHTVSSQLFVS